MEAEKYIQRRPQVLHEACAECISVYFSLLAMLQKNVLCYRYSGTSLLKKLPRNLISGKLAEKTIYSPDLLDKSESICRSRAFINTLTDIQKTAGQRFRSPQTFSSILECKAQREGKAFALCGRYNNVSAYCPSLREELK